MRAQEKKEEREWHRVGEKRRRQQEKRKVVGGWCVEGVFGIGNGRCGGRRVCD